MFVCAALITQQHSDDMKAVAHEVKDCKMKLESAGAYVIAFIAIFTWQKFS